MMQSSLYLWLKAVHIIFMVAWFAGLFYIFRLFVYHVKYRENREIARIYQSMEYKLVYLISYPAMSVTLIFGLFLLYLNPDVFLSPWFHLKLLGVLGLLAYQFFAEYVRRQFIRENYFLTERSCRFLNEVPTILLILIVILVVVKPHLSWT